jgi:TolA-binding protein
MKAQERHKLKENQFARSVAQAREAFETRKRDITWAVTVIVVLLVLVGGYTWWRQSRGGQATDLFAQALAVYQSPVVPPAAPAPGSPAPIQQPGTFMTERAKLEAALPKFIEAADRYPSTDSGIAARYHAASILATLGRYGEAEQRYQEVVAKAGTNSLYSRTARLGLADSQVAQKKYDNAIAIYTELSRDKNSQMPIDGVLMQLGRACVRAGKKAEAVTAFTRITTEFPQSPYLGDAQQELEAAKKLS